MGEEVLLRMEAEGFDQLSAEMRRASGLLHAELRKTVMEVAEAAAKEARRFASEAGSRSIPPTIHVVDAGDHAEVRAGGAATPIAELWELGNKGSPRRYKTFRHPVFGDRENWVEQPKHPFLAPARYRIRPLQTELMERALRRAVAGSGLELRRVP